MRKSPHAKNKTTFGTLRARFGGRGFVLRRKLSGRGNVELCVDALFQPQNGGVLRPNHLLRPAEIPRIRPDRGGNREAFQGQSQRLFDGNGRRHDHRRNNDVRGSRQIRDDERPVAQKIRRRYRARNGKVRPLSQGARVCRQSRERLRRAVVLPVHFARPVHPLRPRPV